MSLQPHQREALVRMGIDVASGEDRTVLVSLSGINVRVVDGFEAGTMYIINEDEVRRMWKEMAERTRRAPLFLLDDSNSFFYIPPKMPAVDPALARWEDDGGPPAPEPRPRTVWKSPALGFSSLSIIP